MLFNSHRFHYSRSFHKYSRTANMEKSRTFQEQTNMFPISRTFPGHDVFFKDYSRPVQTKLKSCFHQLVWSAFFYVNLRSQSNQFTWTQPCILTYTNSMTWINGQFEQIIVTAYHWVFMVFNTSKCIPWFKKFAMDFGK